MRLNPRQIEAFRAVMLTGSMTNAAESLHITQPAVSRLIRELEGQLQFRLFRRDGNRLTPTYEGTILFAEVDRLYVGIDRIAMIATDLQHKRVGSLRIAAMGALALSCITEGIKQFHLDKPGVNITLEGHNSNSILELIAGRHFDVGFAQGMGEYPGVDMTPLPPVEAVCIIPVGYPLAEKLTITPQDLSDQPYISLGKNSPLRLKIDQLFSKEQIPRYQVLECAQAASIAALVASGLGVSIIDPFSATTFSNSNFVIRPFKPKLTFDVICVTSSNYQNSGLCDEFSSIINELFESMQLTNVVHGETITTA